MNTPHARAEMLALVNRHYLGDEESLVTELCRQARATAADSEHIIAAAGALVAAVRSDRHGRSALERFLAEYSLDSNEGVLLMCLAEAFQRVPDTPTVDALLSDKLALADWADHLHNADFLVNSATWGLMLGGHLLPAAMTPANKLSAQLLRIAARIGEPIVRAAVAHAMSIMGDQFVMGADIDQALSRVTVQAHEYELFSFDMLGEAAVTTDDAAHNLDNYVQAIDAISRAPIEVRQRSGISVKLSALFPRYEPSQAARACKALAHSAGHLASRARAVGIPITIDAEESARLTLSLEVFAALNSQPDIQGWDGLGLAVQAYQKRAPEVLKWLARLATESGRIIPVRLVKGAYWDTEIKQAQIDGLADYPVYTVKCNTDVAYLACARHLLDLSSTLYAQFATHNAHSVASIVHFAGRTPFEFQRLHGMGEALYSELNALRERASPCRVYAPVGDQAALLPYLVRRLLENGANLSFVHRIADSEIAISEITADPVAASDARAGKRRHAAIPIPSALYGAQRRNSAGHNFADPVANATLLKAMRSALEQPLTALPLIDGKALSGELRTIFNPADTRVTVGHVADADVALAGRAMDAAEQGWPAWENTIATKRAEILERVSDLFEQRGAQLIAVIVAESGRTIVDAHAELREAIDFLRFYANECERMFGQAVSLPGPAGEINHLGWRGRGVFCCISPWNFPLAIFTGQIAAALAAGNSVIAKPAEQASLTAACAIDLMHEGGIPPTVLHLLPGGGATLGAVLLSDPRVAGVAFTGSDATARDIAQTLAARPGPLPTLIAETGGINAMIADSTALPEQLVRDALRSAFNSAGQRCSSLRVLCLQRDIAPRCLDLLRGAMRELIVGNPFDLATDVGPLIDADARRKVSTYIDSARRHGCLIEQLPVTEAQGCGRFVPPALIRINSIDELAEEIFGPVLHVFEFDAGEFEATLDAINKLGYGLTFGLHSRITERATTVATRIRAGNIYVNRDMIGAVVEAQPFGGRGLSGTGPKAGGRTYLTRFGTEQTVSINAAAVGGNPSLLDLAD